MGMFTFSKESLIADKLSLLFNGDIKQICRRCRDIYLYSRWKWNYKDIQDCLKVGDTYKLKVAGYQYL